MESVLCREAKKKQLHILLILGRNNRTLQLVDKDLMLEWVFLLRKKRMTRELKLDLHRVDTDIFQRKILNSRSLWIWSGNLRWAEKVKRPKSRITFKFWKRITLTQFVTLRISWRKKKPETKNSISKKLTTPLKNPNSKVSSSNASKKSEKTLWKEDWRTKFTIKRNSSKLTKTPKKPENSKWVYLNWLNLLKEELR